MQTVIKSKLWSKAILFIFCSILINLINAQNCEFEDNKYDKVTKSYLISIKSKLSIELKSTMVCYLAYENGQTVLAIGASYYRNSDMTIDTSQVLNFILENDSVLTFLPLNNYEGYIKKGSGENNESLYISPNYYLTREQLALLAKYKIIALRLNYSQGGTDKYDERELEEKNQEQMIEIANCLVEELEAKSL